MMQLDYMWLNY